MSPTPSSTYLYKILPSAPPSPLPDALPLSALDANDGFIHLSTATQVPGTAGRFFTSHTTLWILRLRADVFHEDKGNGKLVWESAGDHGVFPHLYGGNLGREVVDQVLVFERGEGEAWEGVLGGLEQ